MDCVAPMIAAIERRFFVVAWLAALLAAGSVCAQQELPPSFEFNFSNPGARSMGFGGAFAALADDATTAFANPAGLVQLVDPEISIEGRSWSYSTPYVSGGRIWGPPTGIGEDTTEGVRTSTSDKNLSGLSFLSFVYPKGRWSFAFYRHLLSNYEFEGLTQGLYSGPWPDTGSMRREFAYDRAVDVQIVSYAVAAAYELTETLSLGAAINSYEGDISMITDVYGKVQSGIPPEEFFAPIPIVPENLFYTASLLIDDRDWGLNLGIHWRPTETWSFGGFFREGPEFETVAELRTGPTYVDPGLSGQVVESETGNVRFPIVYGLGATYRSGNDRVTLSFEWDRVEYSSIFSSDDELHIDDGNEFHLGGEYAFLKTAPIVSLRAGIWLDPDHQISASGDNYVANAVLSPGEDQMHYAVGLGLAFTRFQLDLAADFSELIDTLSLSFIYSF
jgi:long-subunit fatty acid transport protein